MNDQSYEQSRPVPSVDFEYPDEPEQPEREVDAQQLAEFSRRLLATILRGKTGDSIQRRAKVCAYLLAPSLCHPATTKAALARLLGISRTGAGKLVRKISQELREKPPVSARSG